MSGRGREGVVVVLAFRAEEGDAVSDFTLPIGTSAIYWSYSSIGNIALVNVKAVALKYNFIPLRGFRLTLSLKLGQI